MLPGSESPLLVLHRFCSFSRIVWLSKLIILTWAAVALELILFIGRRSFISLILGLSWPNHHYPSASSLTPHRIAVTVALAWENGRDQHAYCDARPRRHGSATSLRRPARLGHPQAVGLSLWKPWRTGLGYFYIWYIMYISRSNINLVTSRILWLCGTQSQDYKMFFLATSETTSFMIFLCTRSSAQLASRIMWSPTDSWSTSLS